MDSTLNPVRGRRFTLLRLARIITKRENRHRHKTYPMIRDVHLSWVGNKNGVYSNKQPLAPLQIPPDDRDNFGLRLSIDLALLRSMSESLERKSRSFLRLGKKTFFEVPVSD